jgi:hypothetical protein
MIAALQTLVDNGLSDSALDAALADLIEGDSFDDDDDRRMCVALAWYRDNESQVEPDSCAMGYGDTVEIDGCEYRVLSDDEADAACKEYVEESLWAFNPGFLSEETGIDDSVFMALANRCEGANDAIRSIVDGSCGIDSLVDSAVSADGRGHFLSGYDGKEQEHDDYYLYRVN